MKGRRRQRTTILLVLVSSACVWHAAPTIAKQRSKPSGASETALAKRLVGATLHARSAGGRANALLTMMRALHIAVVTPAGRPLVARPEVGAARLFSLYSFELRGLGDSLTRPPDFSLTDVAATLSRAGLTLNARGAPLPPGLVQEGLVAAVRDAVKHPRLGRSLLALIVREFGLHQRRGYDLARNPSPARIHLNGVQQWLIAADVEIAVLRHVRLSAAKASDAPSAAVASLLTDTCDRLNRASDDMQAAIERRLGGKIQAWIASQAVGKIGERIEWKLGMQLTRWGIANLPSWAVRGAYEYIKTAAQSANLAGAILDMLHGALLAASVTVEPIGPENLPAVHWYHTAGEPGHQLTFAIRVRMLDNYGQPLIKCGNLLGLTFPPPGPVPDVPISWQQAQTELTPAMGKLDCGLGPLCITKTDGGGIARVTFTPRTETIPGYGLEQEATGVLDGIAAYQTAAGSGKASQIAQLLTPKYAGFRWHVTYHKEPRLTLRLVDTRSETYTNANITPGVLGKYETTGAGSMNFALSALAPLTKVTTTDGTTLWTGDAPINWDTFNYHDDGSAQFCQDGRLGTDDRDGSSPHPGELVVDSVQRDPTAAAPGLVVTLHTTYPTYLVTDTWHQGPTACKDFTSTYTVSRPVPSRSLYPGVTFTGAQSPSTSGTMRISGWTQGPASQGRGGNLYAYRDVTYSEPGPYGQPPSTGQVRLEILADPAP